MEVKNGSIEKEKHIYKTLKYKYKTHSSWSMKTLMKQALGSK